MTPQRLRAGCVLATAIVLGACAANAPPRFHTLLDSAAAVAAPASASAAPAAVFLEPVRIPVAVDQPPWLVRLPDDTLARLEAERWASPLRDEIRLALLEHLKSRHGIADARASSDPADAAHRVGIEITRFESIPGLEARLEGLTSIRAPGARAATRCSWVIRESVPDGMLALGAGHRRAVVRLADAVARQLHSARCDAG